MKKKLFFHSSRKERLDKFLTRNFPEFSRSFWQKLIKKKKVLVNEKSEEKKYLLKTGDKISVCFDKELTKKNLDTTEDFKVKLEVIAETDDFLVVNKPAGLLVHPTRIFNLQFLTSKQKTLVDWLLRNYPEVKMVGDEPRVRPGIVHRLDKDVSGLLVVAKNQRFFNFLKKQFQERKVKKEYLALVYGCPAKNKGIISWPLTRSKKHFGKIIAVTTYRSEKIKREKKALTEYEVMKKFVGLSLLKIKIKTGRTHQIRVHLKSIGCPVIGDKKYRIRNKELKKGDNLDRIFLHAYKLGFYDLKNQWQEFKVDLPEKLKKFLKTCEK